MRKTVSSCEMLNNINTVQFDSTSVFVFTHTSTIYNLYNNIKEKTTQTTTETQQQTRVTNSLTQSILRRFLLVIEYVFVV